MSTKVRFQSILLLFAMAVISGCATSGNTTSDAARFANLLVVGVAGDYESRAQFERVVVSGLRAAGVDAQPYHRVVGGDKVLAREDVVAAIEEHGFDAVVVTRVLDTDSEVEVRSGVTGTKISRKDDGFMKLFRYDYEELGGPLNISVNMQVTFMTELYSSASQDMVWSTESKGPQTETVAQLVDDAAELVVRHLRRSGKLARY